MRQVILQLIGLVCLFSHFSRKSSVFIARVCPDRRGPVSPSHSLPPGARPYLAPDYSLCYPATLSSHWSIHFILASNWSIHTDTGSCIPAPPSHCKPVHPSLSLAAPGTFEDTDRPGPGCAGGYWIYCHSQVKILSLAWAGLGWGLF